ncbi:MAG: hypothetical protein JWR35_3166 [Marmoricola sp.]|nr:hypothetical protein [Marmoricola sp.]
MTVRRVHSRRVRIIGIGSGHPDQVTHEAAAALRGVAFVIAADKAGPDQPRDRLLEAREEIARRYGDVPVIKVSDPERDRDDVVDYRGAVRDWHEARVAAYEAVLVAHEGDAAFLVWGDPAFYDSTIRIVEGIQRRGRVSFEYDVIPGISSVQVLAARHRIVLHEVGQPILITTGRRLSEAVDQGHDNIVVMLDGNLACVELEGEWQIWWGANLGTADERLVSGRLADVRDELRVQRDTAKGTSGWVMDTYLLRRPVPQVVAASGDND